jgi:succinate dehydrogenase / fumarate reductase cytochrome b subunit
VWLFAAKWGITPGVKARRRFGYLCFAGGILLAGMGLASIWAFVGGKYPNVPVDPRPGVSQSIACCPTQIDARISSQRLA